jgi:hypothetical protein
MLINSSKDPAQAKKYHISFLPKASSRYISLTQIINIAERKQLPQTNSVIPPLFSLLLIKTEEFRM